MSDDFIRSLQDDWRAQDHDADRILRDLRRARWLPHVVILAEILLCIFAFGTGLWFAWVALHTEEHQLLFSLSAAVLLLSAPALCVAGVIARRPGLAWEAETPESLLRVGVRRAESSLRAIRIGRWSAAILGAFLTTLWALELLGLLRAIEFLVPYTAICSLVAVVSLLWMSWRARRARRERDACLRLLSILQVDLAGEHDKRARAQST
jgi:hypothetical protein